MGVCLYCPETADTEEHWLPRGFGAIKGMFLLKDRLCRKCNHELGHELDEEITRTGPTGMLRSLLKIRGRHKTPFNPFHYRVMGKESATTMTMQCDHDDYRILGEAYTDDSGEAHVRPLRQLVFKRADGEMVCVPFPPAYDGARLAALLKERGIGNAKLEEIYLDEHESHENPQLKQVIKEAIGHFDATAYGGGNVPSGRQNVPMSAGISNAYFRALAKVGFHYYLTMSTTHTGGELLFQPIREFIRHAEGDWHSFVRLMGPQFIAPLREGHTPTNFSHFFGVDTLGRRIVAALQFFVGPDHITQPSFVELGLSARPGQFRGHWVSYYGEKIDGYDGEMRALT